MKETELKPCPFCGSPAIAEINHIDGKFYIFCESCLAEINIGFQELGLGDGSIMSFGEVKKAMKRMEELWNRRATDGNS